MQPTLKVTKVRDFALTGRGSASAWRRASWQPLAGFADNQAHYASRFKTVYSTTGIYFLFDCEDKQLTCTLTTDFADLYNEDVVEVFLWPDTTQDLYFEYEASPLGTQLPLLVPNHKGTFFGWRPWHFEKDRLTMVKTTTRGGPRKSMAKVKGWMAEFFIPFTLLKGLGNTPPTPGTKWRANMYRIDYDQIPQSHWTWSPVSGRTFHDPHHFGTILFE